MERRASKTLVVHHLPEMLDFWAGALSIFGPVVALHCASEEDQRGVLQRLETEEFTSAYVGNGAELAIRIKQQAPSCSVSLICGDLTTAEKDLLKASGYEFTDLLEAQPADQERAESGIEAEGEADRLTVLVVARGDVFSEAISDQLGKAGHNVWNAECSDHTASFDALEHARWMRFDVAFLDSQIPTVRRSVIAGSLGDVSPCTRIVVFGSADTSDLRKDGVEFELIKSPAEVPGVVEATLTRKKQKSVEAPEDVLDVRESTSEILLRRARNLERRAEFLDSIAKKLQELRERRDVEITDEDIPF